MPVNTKILGRKTCALCISGMEDSQHLASEKKPGEHTGGGSV